MSLETGGNTPSKEKEGGKSGILDTVGEVKDAVKPLVQTPKVSFRRVMFQSIFTPPINKLLDDLCLDFFMKTTGWFDEIVIIKVENNEFLPVYDYSLRDKSEPAIAFSEFQELATIGNKLHNGDWKYITEAEGSDFDMVGKINESYLIAVNNTNASIDELEMRYPNRTFEEVKPVIERMIAELRDDLPM